MTSPRWADSFDDDALLAELGRALAEPAVPAHVAEAARAAFTWRTIDEELAALVFDSVLAGSGAVRGTAGRTLVFEAGTLSVEIEVNDGEIVGQLIPPQPGRVQVLTGSGVFAESVADEVGSFTIGRPASGPVRLACRVDSGGLTTDWLSL